MKKVIFVTLLVSCLSTLFSQTIKPQPSLKKVRFGFGIGVNVSNLAYDEKLPEFATIEQGAGYRVSGLAHYEVSNWLSLSPKAAISFHHSKVIFRGAKQNKIEYQIMPVAFEFMFHAVLKKESQKLSPYLIVGPNIRVPLSPEPSDTISYSTNSDIAIDVGIGLDKAFEYFYFAPELRYSYGLLNLSQNPEVPNLRLHSIAVVFTFR